MEILRMRKIKVFKTINKTNYFKKSNERELMKFKEDSGVLGLIVSIKLYGKEYEPNHKLDIHYNNMKHSDFFKYFDSHIGSLNYFELGYLRKFIYNSIKKHENSYFILSLLFSSYHSRSDDLIEHIHKNMFDRKVKDISDMRLNLINYVLNEKPKDLLSDSFYPYLNNRKNHIVLERQFVFYK